MTETEKTKLIDAFQVIALQMARNHDAIDPEGLDGDERTWIREDYKVLRNLADQMGVVHCLSANLRGEEP